MLSKKIGCGLLAFVMMLAPITPIQSSAAGKFSDVSGHWAESYINTAVNAGFIKGYPDGHFMPDKAVTRAEFTTMVNKALGISSSGNANFTDVNYNEWYYSDVSKAVAACYAGGYDDKTFRPSNPISRQEAAVMISRFVPSYGSNGNLRSYSDYNSVADWASAAMSKVNGKGYIGAYNDGKIHPADQLTRAQTAKILCDILQKESVVTTSTVVKSDTTLSGKIYSGDVTIHKDLGEKSATIDNCVILGNLYIQGGGVNTVTVNNSRIASASVDKDNTPVRVLAKGETGIVSLSASDSSVLQTSSLSGGLYGAGFSNVNVNSSAQVTFRGSFPLINVNGSRAKLILDSGTISELNVSSGGRYSDITAESGTTINNATVNSESYFHGTGTISNMSANASGITYETKPRDWTIASSVSTPTSASPKLSVTYSPKNGDTGVNLDSKITATFTYALKLYNGGSISNSDIKNIFTLRKDSANGSTVSFSGTVDSAKKVFTLTPDSNLTSGTRYYLILERNTVKDSNGNPNQEDIIYFNTGSTTSVSTSFSPANGAVSVAPSTGITVSFSRDVVRYSNGATISSSDSYLKECILFRKTNANGSDIPYTATISSSKKTITIVPTSSLVLDQKYYIAVVSNKLKTSDGIVVPASEATWTTGVTTPNVTALTLTPGTTLITANVTSNIAGTVYLVALPSSNAAPSAAQVVAGQNAQGVSIDSSAKINGSISAGSTRTYNLTGLTSNTSYTVYAVVYGNGSNSAVKSATATTAKATVQLSGLQAVPTVPGYPGAGNQISFNENTTNYTLNLNTSIDELTVSASGSGDISINSGTATSNSSAKTISLSDTAQTVIPVTIKRDGANATTYTITVVPTNNADMSVTVKADGSTLSNSDSQYQLTTTGATSIQIDVTTSDKFASVSMNGGQNTVHTGSASFTMDAGSSDQTYQFTVTSGTEVKKYTVTLQRPSIPKQPDQQIQSTTNTLNSPSSSTPSAITGTR